MSVTTSKDRLQVNNDHVQYITIYYYKPEGLSESTHTSVGCPLSSPPSPLSLCRNCCITGVMGRSRRSRHPHNRCRRSRRGSCLRHHHSHGRGQCCGSHSLQCTQLEAALAELT